MKLLFKGCLYESINPLSIPAFKNWFGDSKVVDGAGNPLPVYHGTTHSFDVFDIRKAYSDSYVGKGFYFTSGPEDAEINYTGGGDDQINRIQQLIEKLEGELENEEYEDLSKELNISEEEIEKAVENNTINNLINEYANNVVVSKEHGPSIIPVYLKMENPFYIGEYTKQFFDYVVEYDEESDEWGEESGSAVEILENARYKMNDKAYGKLLENLPNLEDNEGFSSNEFFNAIINNDYLMDEDEGAREIFKEIILSSGFDGVIMDANTFKMKAVESENHYIVYNPNQIKSIYNRNPTTNDSIINENLNVYSR